MDPVKGRNGHLLHVGWVFLPLGDSYIDQYIGNIMSWVKSVASSEDVFDQDVDDISLLNKEWKYNMEKRAKVCERLVIWDAPITTCRQIYVC